MTIKPVSVVQRAARSVSRNAALDTRNVTDALAAKRISGRTVPPLIPAHGNVFVLIVGEAPGPRGADKSGFPFFGDAAGKHLYHALRELGAIQLPYAIDAMKWDGAVFAAAGLAPVARGISLGNALDRCPTDDGKKFRAPTRAELEGDDNIARILGEVAALRDRGLTGVVTLGKVAERTLRFAMERGNVQGVSLVGVPHPSAQGLLSMAENRGRGARMADLQQQWMAKCIEAVHVAGYRSEGGV